MGPGAQRQPKDGPVEFFGWVATKDPPWRELIWRTVDVSLVEVEANACVAVGEVLLAGVKEQKTLASQKTRAGGVKGGFVAIREVCESLLKDPALDDSWFLS